MTFAPPRAYEFNESDRDRERYFAFPVRMLADLRELPGSAISCVPPLAFLTFPKRARDAAIAAECADASDDFTHWGTCSARWLGTLSGIDKGSALRALDSLVECGLIQTRTVPRAKREGGRQTIVRLSKRLFAGDRELFVAIPGTLVFGGTWCLLPTSSSRHVYLAVACLGHIRNPAAYARSLQLGGVDDSDELTQERQEASPVSLAMLEDATGLRRSTILEAISILTKPLFEGDKKSFGLVIREDVPGRQWKACWRHPAALNYFWNPDYLNVPPAQLQKHRDELWPELEAKRSQRQDALRRQKLGKRIREQQRLERKDELAKVVNV